MQEHSRYAVGIDIGTTTVRCVVGHIDPTSGTPSIIGVGKSTNSGMRKGTIVNLAGPAKAIDEALGEAERMSGYEVNAATLSINGSHILSTPSDGMIAVGAMDHEINHNDLARLEEVSTVGKVPANREVLEVVAHSYKLDGQDNIKDPVGMTGTRLEINANVVSALAPYVINVQKAAEMATVESHGIVVAGIAAARAVLSERQLESGVAVVDLGGSTTNIAVFEEGDLQYAGVIPVGQVNVTNDLAICLKTDPEIAELIKLAYGGGSDGETSVAHDKQKYTYDNTEISQIIEARLEEIFELVQKELKKAGRAGQLPSGIVLTGAGAHLKGVVSYAKDQLGLAVKVGKPAGYGGVAEGVDQPEYATAVGLMLIDAHSNQRSTQRSVKSSHSGSGPGLLRGLLRKLKS